MESRSGSSLSSPQLPYLSSIPPPAPSGTEGFHMYDRVSPNMLVLLIILAAIFFISAALHLLVRFLLRPLPRDLDQDDDASALQGPLQQLFHLHDAGVDQSFIDAAFPVFTYKAIVGVKDPFDCAVCLCEFLPDDKLRLLPKCSHAFHVDCIDTWLLSHSTCPLCRASLLADFPPLHCHSPAALLLEAGGQSSPAIISDYTNNTNNNSIRRLSLHSNDELRAEKSGEIQLKDEGNRKPAEKVVSVKLGKFRSIIDGGSNNSSIVDDNADPRRCFSTGSFEYVMNESSSLRVAINPPTTKQPRKKTLLPLASSHRQTMSECGCEPFGSWRDLNGFESQRRVDEKCRSIAKESFSVSKIWIKGAKRNESRGSRRAFSFRFPINHGLTCGEGSNGKSGVRRVVSEIDMVRWNHGGRRSSSTNLGSEASAPSFARRTLFWFIGRSSKVVHLSSASSVHV